MKFSDTQQSFFANSYHNINILSGSVSSGKTFISNLRFLKQIYDSPKNSLLIAIGKTSETIKDNVIDPIIVLDGGRDLILKLSPLRIYCKSNRCTVVCCGGSDGSSWERIQGKTTAGALFDEATTLPQTIIQNVIKGCRLHGKTWPVIFTCNPSHPRHYIKSDYIDNKELDVRTWEFRLPDNPILSDALIKQTKSLYSGSEYEKMIEGKWTAAEGLIYTDYNKTIHNVNDDETKGVSFKEFCLAIDWGWENPLAILYVGVDYDGKYYFLDEIYKNHQHVDQSLKDIMIQKGWLKFPISYCYADSNNPENINYLRNLGFNAIGVCKDVIPGITKCQSELKNNNIKVHNKCFNLISELESYAWINSVYKEQPAKENDHALDAFRYIIYSRERNRAKIITKNPFAF